MFEVAEFNVANASSMKGCAPRPSKWSTYSVQLNVLSASMDEGRTSISMKFPPVVSSGTVNQSVPPTKRVLKNICTRVPAVNRLSGKMSFNRALECGSLGS